jgi:hypothetical protein
LHHEKVPSHTSFSTTDFFLPKTTWLSSPLGILFSVSPIADKTEWPPIRPNWGDRRRIVGGAEHPHKTRLPEYI